MTSFRAYNRVTKDVINHEDLLNIIRCRANNHKYDPFRDNKMIIDMGTRVKDINHQEVFENDIIETTESKKIKYAYIVKGGMATAFEIGKSNKIGKALPSKRVVDLQLVEGLKIIGNTHINKDLL